MGGHDDSVGAHTKLNGNPFRGVMHLGSQTGSQLSRSGEPCICGPDPDQLADDVLNAVA